MNDEIPMEELYRHEVEAQTAILTDGLLALEHDPSGKGRLEELMRAAHSLKGAARLIGHDASVRVAHALEDCFVRAQASGSRLPVNLLLQGVDLLTRLAADPDQSAGVSEVVAALASGDTAAAVTLPPVDVASAGDRSVRITAERLDRLLGLAGESLVGSRWLAEFSARLSRLKTLQRDVVRGLERLGETGRSSDAPDALLDAMRMAAECRDAVAASIDDLEGFEGRSSALAHRLYNEVLECRMRPFADGVTAVPRMVRDVAQSLGKEVRIEIVGESTTVDRDILRRLDAPLGHLLRNVVDHGIESPDERLRSGKPAAGHVLIEARHHAGALVVTIADDGRGIDVEAIRRVVIERRLTMTGVAATLRDAELFEFLFLPGFSLKGEVTTISGRGVGLDAVRTMVHEVGGTIDITSTLGRGTRVQLHLPLTLSVVRALLVEIAGEPYAVPLARVVQVHHLLPADVQVIQARAHMMHDGHHVALGEAHEVLELTHAPREPSSHATVIVVGDRGRHVALVIDRLLGERELVIRPLDPRLNKVADISAAALMSDGEPVLVLDADDLITSVEALGGRGRLASIGAEPVVAKPARVLVVDDSITVREMERKLLERGGYDVDVAVDGMEAWNAVRSVAYDLVVTDVDMPRLDGIELVRLIRQDGRLKSIPIMIVSYKDREEDRLRGLDAGADYYLTKASFHDDTLLRAAADLIGAEAA